jgi:tetraacyldisaccharide 4'-kinase
VNVLLAPWRAVNRVRRWLYRAGVLRAKRLHRPVISVGNIAAGGTGKTPAVIAVCRFLESRGLRVAVLSRGYGRTKSATAIVQDHDAVKYGDEPVLIKQQTKADVIVGVNRYESGRDHEADVFVLDDGFQHLQLRRDFDLVIDAPAKYYREGRSALRAADAVIPRRLRTLVPDALRGQRVVAFAGLADNDQFFAALREAGVQVEATRSFPDHHRYTEADLAALRRHGLPLVTTEKDKVKIADADVLAVGAEMEIDRAVLEQIAAIATGERMRERAPKRRKNRLLQRVEYAAYRFVARRVLSMSVDSVSRWGNRLGNLGKVVLRGRDRLGMRNLRYVYPERPEHELRRILDECWRHFGREALLSVQTQNLSLEELAERVPFQNLHHLEESIARGKGTVIISAHWGGWEAAGLALMARVRNVLTVARPLDNELLERELQQIRARTGAAVVDRRKAARALMRGLSENAVVVLLPDQAVLPREGVLVPFLGRPAWTTPAPAKMAIRAGSTIVFGFCIPHGLRQRVEFEDPIQTESGMDAEELTARINAVIARRIHERPELWLWMHDRWKGTGEKET